MYIRTQANRKINRNGKKNHKRVSGILIITAMFLIAGTAGCSANQITETTKAEENLTISNETAQTDEDKESTAESEQDVFATYKGFLGQKKEYLTEALKEEPSKIDEGVLEYLNSGIRVWFDEKSLVNQIWVASDSVDLRGSKLGDDLQKFKDVFGEPVKDKEGEAHFDYDSIFVVAQYDTTTKEVFAVYLLTEDYEVA